MFENEHHIEIAALIIFGLGITTIVVSIILC